MKSNSEDKEIELSLKIKDTPEIFVDTIHNVRLVKNPKKRIRKCRTCFMDDGSMSITNAVK